MTRRLLVSALLICVGVAPALYAQARQATPPPPAAAQATTNNVAVTVTYTGKGAVDATHKIMVFLFSKPELGPNSNPIGPPQLLEKNGTTATFTNVTTNPVYIVALYDEKGGYTGRGSPPPTGTPVAMLSKDQKDPKSPATPIAPGPKTAVKMSFSDARRWQ